MRTFPRFRPFLVSALAALVLASCASAPRVTFDPSSAELGALAQSALGAGQNLHSVTIVRDGRTLVEGHADGWDQSLSSPWPLAFWSSPGPSTLHDGRSVTKSVVALLAGTVLARHPEASLDLRVVDFPELAAQASSAGLGVTLADLLGMTTGLEWKEWGHPWWDSDETSLALDPRPLRHVLDRPRVAPSGTRFVYSGGATQVAARMLELIDGRPLEAVAQADLWEPLGIEEVRWARGPGGALAFAGLALSSTDLVKLGELMLSGGDYRGRSVVPPSWIATLTTPRVPTDTALFDLEGPTWYGLGWWTSAPGAPTPWFSAVGNGGQKVFVVPSLALVVVLTAGNYGDPSIQRWETDLLAAIVRSVREPTEEDLTRRR